MPVSLTYPGVYVQELPSGSRTITGVATSVTAFVGRAARGPVDTATTVFSFGEFERTFGGLHKDCPMSYSVQQFFLNGGGQAIILRVLNRLATLTGTDVAAKAGADIPGDGWWTFEATSGGIANNDYVFDITADGTSTTTFKLKVTKPDASVALATTTVSVNPDAATYVNTVLSGASVPFAAVEPVPQKAPGAVTLTTAGGAEQTGTTAAVAATAETKVSLDKLFEATAANEGAWGNRIRVSIDHDTADTSDTSLFNVIVQEFADGANREEDAPLRTEKFYNVSADSAATRYVDDVIEQESRLIDSAIVLDGTRPPAGDYDLAGGLDGAAVRSDDLKEALELLDKVDLFNLLVCPPPSWTAEFEHQDDAIAACAKHNAMFLMDPPKAWTTTATVDLAGVATRHKNAAVFFPMFHAADPLNQNRLRKFAPGGAIAGLIARTDSNFGVWKAPAGIDATLLGVRKLDTVLTDQENGQLNQIGVNCLRTFPVVGTVSWGARTLRGADVLADEWKYLPVRRTALYISESLLRGTQWAVFQPNDEPLWSELRKSIGSFMHQMFRKGAFKGSSPKEAYFVKCDGETTTQADVDLGIVNILVGFAPLKPAEFVVISLQQMAGESAS